MKVEKHTYMLLVFLLAFLLLASGCGKSQYIAMPPEQGHEGKEGPGGPTGEQGEEGQDGEKGEQGDVVSIATYAFSDGECRKIAGVDVKRQGSTLRLYMSSGATCSGPSFARLDSDEELYWVDDDTLFMINLSNKLFVLQF